MSLEKTATIAANPSTARGLPVHLSYDARTNRIAYASGKSIFLRSVDDPSKCTQYTEHKVVTTVATFSPSGYYVASGDEDGVVRVWDCASEDLISKGEYAVLSGRINAIAWDADSKRIIAVGDGKERYGHCFTYDSGNTVGEVSGHTSQVNAVTIRPCRPYRAATVSDDAGLVFYQGPPFKFAQSVRGKHTNFVRDVKFSPSGSHIVSVGADRSIVLYDGKTGQFQRQIPDAHDGGIFAVDWYDETSFVTCSADCTVRLWVVDSPEKPQKVWKMESKTTANQLLGVVRTKDYVIALNLAGDLYYFDDSSESAVKVVFAHQKSITALSVLGDRIFTGSYDGRILSWGSDSKAGELIGGKDAHTNLVVGISPVSKDRLVTAAWDDTVASIDMSSLQISRVESLEEQPVQIASCDGAFALITDSKVSVYDSDCKVTSESKLAFTPSALAISKSFVVVSDSATFKTHIYDKGLKPVNGKDLKPMRGKPSFARISPNEKYLAVGDSNGKIFCYDLSSGELVTSRWAFHTSRITSISWNEDNDHVIASSLDTNLIVYSVSKPVRNVKAMNTHKEGVSGVEWIGPDRAVSVGADACLKFWDVVFK